VVFELDHWERGGWTVLSVNGELDVATAPRLRQEAVKLVTGGATQMAIDLSGCGFLDSTGLGVIIGILKRVRGHEGELVIVGAEPHVRKVFEITRVSDIVPLHDSLDEVVGAVGDG
jgi:anti-sigma B factor antagonist